MTKLFLSSSMIESTCNQNSQTLQVLNLEKCGGTHDESLSKDQIHLANYREMCSSKIS